MNPFATVVLKRAMTPSATKWLLFAAMFCAVPVPYYMFVIAGLLPLIAIFRMSVDFASGARLFDMLHLAVYGTLFYLAARYLTHWLFSRPPRVRILGVSVALALAVLISLLPIYGVGHGNYSPVNLYALFRDGWLA
jgi:hypothetical protein